jgi:hypothetical protein
MPWRRRRLHEALEQQGSAAPFSLDTAHLDSASTAHRLKLMRRHLGAANSCAWQSSIDVPEGVRMAWLGSTLLAEKQCRRSPAYGVPEVERQGLLLREGRVHRTPQRAIWGIMIHGARLWCELAGSSGINPAPPLGISREPDVIQVHARYLPYSVLKYGFIFVDAANEWTWPAGPCTDLKEPQVHPG